MTILIVLWDTLFFFLQFLVLLQYLLIYNIIDLLVFAFMWWFCVRSGRATIKAFKIYRRLIKAQLILSAVGLVVLGVWLFSYSRQGA